VRSLALLTIMSLLSVGALAQTPAADSTPPGNAETGKKLFVQYGCYQCHGYAAHGGAGPRLAPRPLTFAALSRYIRQPKGEMPPYTTKVLSEQQLADVYAFLRSVPEPPSVDSIPLLKSN